MKSDDVIRFLEGEDKPNEQEILEINKAISEPELIEDANKFASLLVKIGSNDFIEPLIEVIKKSEHDMSVWLSDYLYALIEILDEYDVYYPIKDDFVHLLGNWLLNTKGGEVSWKSADILSIVKNFNTKDYMLKGALDESLFSGARIACIKGIVNQYFDMAHDLLIQLEADSNSEVKEASKSALQYVINVRDNDQ